MSISARMTRLPHAFDPDIGDEVRAAVPYLTGDMAELVAGAGGSSPYLRGLIRQESEWLEGGLDDPEGAMTDTFDALKKAAPDRLLRDLRQAKRRVAVLTALADLSGAWPLEQVTGTLTDFGGLAADLSAQAEIAKLIRRGKMPGQTEDDIADAGGLVILAMGKMGAGELNYSSDIDLICLFDETRFDADDYGEARAGFVKATRAFSSALSERTADGYVFRTDLRLRPDPAVTPVCIPMEAAERYYESLGRTWERAAYIKARAAAGDITAGERFLETLRPFVWRRHLDFAAIQDAHDIRLRIRESKGTGRRITVPGHDVKLGRGGIREIEFFTQTRQLIAGGRDAGLRQRGTVDGLAALAGKGWVPEATRDALTDHYRALRDIEHRIQMVEDAQTHKVPQSPEGLGRVAALAGMSVPDLTAMLQSRFEEVHHLTEDFFAPGQNGATPAPQPEGEFDASVVKRWQTYPALRSERAAQIFDRIRPELLSRLSRVSKPDEALLALDGFLAGLPAGVQLFSLFEANPQLIDLLVDIVGTSPALAAHLSRNSSVFDAVIGGSFFSEWPGCVALQQELAQNMAAEGDYEARLDAARRWQKEWHFRVGVHLLRGLADPVEAGQQYADLAGAVLAAVYPVVVDQFAHKHGDPPGRGAVVLGMGSLGAARLNARSDLDVIVIYDPEEADMSEGKRPLAVRPYFARLTQALITAMSAPMSQGRLYEVDMRLRPSGMQGPVATSWNSFQSYQRDEAWVWEHLALTRARPVAGAEAVGADVEQFRHDVLHGADPDQVRKEVAEMRTRIQAAKAADSPWDAKTGLGRMQDVELIAQAGTLIAGSTARDTPAGLQAGVASGWLSAADAAALQGAHDLFWSVIVATRLISDTAPKEDEVGAGSAAFLCRITGYERIGDLRDALETAYADTKARVDELLAEVRPDEK
ncbi:MAG: glutamine-synthetase adenylyltransferase [Paracoccaceae bacterium]